MFSQRMFMQLAALACQWQSSCREPTAGGRCVRELKARVHTHSTTKPAMRLVSMTGFSLMFLLPVSSCSFLAIRNCCSCSSFTALRRVATWGVDCVRRVREWGRWWSRLWRLTKV